MKFRTKIYLFLIGLTFGTTFLGLGIVYWQAQKFLFKELRSKVLTIAATAAQEVNGDLLAEIHDRSDVGSPQFDTVVHELRAIRQANRRKDIYVTYIYTIRPDPANGNRMVIGVDATEDQADFAYPGESYPEGSRIGLLNHLHAAWAPDQLATDRWGTFLPGYAPVYDTQGVYVGTLGVNMSADYIAQQLDRVRLFVGVILLITLVIGCIAALFLARIMSASLEIISTAVQRIGHGDLKVRIHMHGTDEFSRLAIAINAMTQGLEERERLKLNFVRYVSKHIMEKILSTDITPTLHGERRKITVLFSDIRKFTHLAEKLPPERVVSLLNEYLEKMLNIIFSNNGTLDKFLGDGLMVEFGAPLDDDEQEAHAVETALQMHLALRELNQKWAREGRPALEMGIGIHTGQAIVGNIGSEERMEYTAIGDTVNVASRLEHMSKQLKVEILISETTKKSLDSTYGIVSFGPINLPGRESPIEVFSVILPIDKEPEDEL